MKCVQRTLGPVSGHLGFHEKAYLGSAHVSDFAASSLVAIAASTEDSVLLHLDGGELVILVDYYGVTESERFSVVIQGGSGLARVAPCFLAGQIGR